jgi:hypothetical protein
VPLWLAAVDEVDAFEVALRLPGEAVQSADPDQAGLARARLLLLAGHPAKALTILSSLHLTDLPIEPAASGPHLLLASCLAATGNHSAYRWLMAAVTTLPGRWEPLYLIGAAAEQSRDFATADQAWTSLVQSHGIVTRFTLTRYLAATVARRDQADSRVAAQTVLDAVEEFVTRDPDLHESPQSILTAAACLRQRGDDAGSALLLHAASHRLPDIAALRAATQPISKQPGVRRLRHRELLLRWMHVPLLAPAAAVAVWCDVPPVVLAGLVPVLVVRRSVARAPMPGFTTADAAAWRAGLRLRQGPAARMVDTDLRFVFALLAAIVLTAMVPIAGAFAAAVTGRPDAIARTSQYAVLTGVIFAVLTAGLTAIGLGLAAVARRHNWRFERRARLQADRHRLSDAADCRCWRSSVLVGSYATAYLERHLVTVHPESYDADLITHATLARCRSTGTLWLATRTEPQDNLVLLRGAERVSAGLLPPATGGYL